MENEKWYSIERYGVYLIILFLCFMLVFGLIISEYLTENEKSIEDKVIEEIKNNKINESNNSEINTNIESKGAKNNIQATHEAVSYSYGNKELRIDKVNIDDFYGSSMQPTIFTGNKLITKDYNGNINKLREGMIITYELEGKIFVHRIKGIYPQWNQILMQGDNLDLTDTIENRQIKKIVIGVIYE